MAPLFYSLLLLGSLALLGLALHGAGRADITLERPIYLGVAGDAGAAENEDDQQDQANTHFRRAGRDAEAADARFQPAQNVDHDAQHDHTDHGAGQALHAANNEHGERDKGHTKIETVDRQHAEEVTKQATGHAAEEGADHKCEQALAENIDAGRLGSDLIVALRAQGQSPF